MPSSPSQSCEAKAKGYNLHISKQQDGNEGQEDPIAAYMRISSKVWGTVSNVSST